MFGQAASDEELMLRYRDGDAAAFDVLYGRRKGGVYRFLLRQCRDRAIAEELFQDVWLNLIRARNRYLAEAKFTTYLYQLARNRCIDHWRKHAPEALRVFDADHGDDGDLPDPAAAAGAEPDSRYAAKQDVERFLELLDALPAPQREAFLLREEAGLDVEQIAAATGVSYETAKSRLRYALGKLKQGMQR